MAAKGGQGAVDEVDRSDDGGGVKAGDAEPLLRDEGGSMSPRHIAAEEGSVSAMRLAANLTTGNSPPLPKDTKGVLHRGARCGAAITAFVLFLNGATCMVLIHGAERHKRFDIGALL
eukprot:gene21555-43494_t